MPIIAVNGATLICTSGSCASKLSCSRNVECTGESIGIESDGLPTNVGTFGNCTIMGTPCSPITTKWTNVSNVVNINNEQILHSGSVLLCSIGGTISVVYPGQKIGECE